MTDIARKARQKAHLKAWKGTIEDFFPLGFKIKKSLIQEPLLKGQEVVGNNVLAKGRGCILISGHSFLPRHLRKPGAAF